MEQHCTKHNSQDNSRETLDSMGGRAFCGPDLVGVPNH